MGYKPANLPSNIKVGTHNYTIEVVPVELMDDIGIYGDLNTDLRRIRIAEKAPEAAHAIEVVIHELLHACYRAYHIEAEHDEEYTVTNLAAALSAVITDNPDLRKWLDRTAKR